MILRKSAILGSLLAAAALSLGAKLNAQAIPTSIGYTNGKPVMQRNGQDVLFTGIQYWGLDSWNVNSWNTDLNRIANKLKLNGVRLNIGWDHIETANNVFHFTQLDALLDKIENKGLMVYLQFNQSAHSWKPAWFEAMVPASDLVALKSDGQTQYSRYSFSSPTFRQYYERYVTTVINHVKDRECIVAYSVYTEPHFKDDPAHWLDYSEHSKAAFRVWLSNKYAGIATYNSACGTSFASFNDVQPYGAPPSDWEALSGKQRQRHLDWSVFNCTAKADFIGGIIQAAKQIDSDHLYGQNMMWKWSGGLAANVLLDPQINYDYADIIGINIYPNASNYEKIGDAVNFIRTLHNNEKIVWLGEFNNKPGGATYTNLINHTDEAYKAGATGWVYFTYRAHPDIAHYGIVDMNGSKLTPYYALKDFVADEVLGQEQSIINLALEPLHAYVLWSQSDLFLAYHEDNRGFEAYRSCRELLKVYGAYTESLSQERFLADDFDNSIPVIVPSTSFIHEDVKTKISADVPNGLKVFVSGRYGEFLVRDQAKVLKEVYPRTDTALDLTLDSHDPIASNAIKVQQNFYMLNTSTDINITPTQDKVAAIETDSAEQIAKWKNDGRAAIIAQDVGSGKLMFCGTHLFELNPSSSNEDFNGRLLASFLQWCGVVF